MQGIKHKNKKNRLYKSRKEEGNGLASIEYFQDAAIRRQQEYAKKNKENQSTAACKSNGNLRSNRKRNKIYKTKLGRKKTYGFFKQKPDVVALKMI